MVTMVLNLATKKLGYVLSLVYLSCSLVFSLMNAQNFSYISNFSLMSIDGYSPELVEKNGNTPFRKVSFSRAFVCAQINSVNSRR